MIDALIFAAIMTAMMFIIGSEFVNNYREINEEETEIEIPFSELEEWKEDETWGTTAELILDNSDKSNAEAHLEIW